MSVWGGEAAYNKLLEILAQLSTDKNAAKYLPVRITDGSGFTAVIISGNVTVTDLLRGLTDPATAKKVNEVDFTVNADDSINTIIFKDSGGITLFTLTFSWSAGSGVPVRIVRS
jgi:hypothetical protein